MNHPICRFFISVFFLIATHQPLSAQIELVSTNSPATPTASLKIGIFAPLYLDSVFAPFNGYKYSSGFPRFTIPAFEFVDGCKTALREDTLSISNIDLTIIDTKSFFFQHSFNQEIESEADSSASDESDKSYTKEETDNLLTKLDSIQIFICLEKDNDYARLARFAQKRNAVFFSVTYPNTGGISDYPKLFMCNPTLRTHCNFIMKRVLDSSNTNVLVVSRKDKQDERIVNYLKAVSHKRQSAVRYIIIDSTWNTADYFDSTKQNVVINASFNEAFALNISSALYNLNKKLYPVTYWGMPNWDGFTNSFKNGLKMFPFQFTSSYYNEKKDSICINIQKKYLNAFKGNPGDYVYKGYEIMRLAMQVNPNENTATLSAQFNALSKTLFSKFRFTENKSGNSNDVDFYENQHLFILKKSGAKITRSF